MCLFPWPPALASAWQYLAHIWLCANLRERPGPWSRTGVIGGLWAQGCAVLQVLGADRSGPFEPQGKEEACSWASERPPATDSP